MRNVNKNVLSAADSASANGSQIDANQLVSASFQVVFGDTHAAGTFKLQASNDVFQDRYQANNFTVTNWTDIPSQSAAISSGASALLTVANMSYRWIRAVFTNSASFKQVQTVTTVADVAGSLNSTYFLVSSIHSGIQKNFYVWFDNGSGVDPAIAGKTGVHVVYSNNATANTLATAIRAALNALTLDFVATGATSAAIITNVENGLATAAADGTAATGFTFANTTPGVTPTTVNVTMNAIGV